PSLALRPSTLLPLASHGSLPPHMQSSLHGWRLTFAVVGLPSRLTLGIAQAVSFFFSENHQLDKVSFARRTHLYPLVKILTHSAVFFNPGKPGAYY
ncbi:MAG: hypothetical protein KAU46_02215, partial [Candidatus Aminicenantes bacterium]|nr:hypothetical protein [Candidatus Aminicenantes bacterium]